MIITKDASESLLSTHNGDTGTRNWLNKPNVMGTSVTVADDFPKHYLLLL